MFGFKEIDDYKSASILNEILSDNPVDLLNILNHKEVAVIGAGPSLEKIDKIREEVIISADGATNYLVSKGIIPDIIVTDLDGIETFPNSVYVVHAHGNNINLLHKVYNMTKVIGTAQVSPFGRINLFGGFTDGDRAVVIAKKFGASKIILYGMDFDSNLIGKFSKPYLLSDVPISWIKRNKLKIAKEIVKLTLEQNL
ncbi:6-hydroxymethylpterin diphosphokinase MptE-like protein [Acidianus brierleyi]|uniref:6-hydroxymethyl-7,8-dihydropterin pyrophosphokinase n=1 Tax=Acidianus brierleyi TaxID=41673 RepID=A0A2U9IBF7_9CREN|nr:DUF115 domain-containing protein [Acidianus brierleyi]